MKKFLVLLTTIAMMMAIVACGGEATTGEENKEQPKEEQKVEQPKEEEQSSEIKVGDKGEGEAELDSKLFSVTIPEGFKYEVYTCAMVDDTNGTVEIDFGDLSTSCARLTVSTQRMVTSLDDAVEKGIALRNLDTYKEGKAEVGEDITFGDVTYRRISFSTEYSGDETLIGYVETEAGLGAYVEIKLARVGGLSFDEDIVKSLIESIEYK